MTYKINRLDDFGRGITYIDGKIAFVFNALENEEVEISKIEEKSKYIECTATKIKNKSKTRKEPLCPYYFECGGCNIMHMNYESQLEFKKKKVENFIEHISKIDTKINDIIPSKEFNYRNKVTLKVKNGILGYFKNKTYDIIPIKRCLLAKEVINEVIEELNKIDLRNVEEIVIRANYQDEVLIIIKGKNIDKEILKKLTNIENIVVIDNGIKEIVKGNDYIIDKISNLLFKVSYDSFFQVNYYGVEKLYGKILEYVSNLSQVNILDLYCGTGTIGLFLSDKAKKVFGIEINKSAINDANYNKKLNNISNIDFLCSDVGLIKSNFKDIDLLVIDPPRSGLEKKAISVVTDINPKIIIYVSCDSMTLSRDLNILKEKYRVEEITPVDMFPNTSHVECVCVLSLR